jgi:hypothetical protein
MKIKSESYPDRIRRIADELSKIRKNPDMDDVAQKLRLIASQLERILKSGRRSSPDQH